MVLSLQIKNLSTRNQSTLKISMVLSRFTCYKISRKVYWIVCALRASCRKEKGTILGLSIREVRNFTKVCSRIISTMVGESPVNMRASGPTDWSLDMESSRATFKKETAGKTSLTKATGKTIDLMDWVPEMFSWLNPIILLAPHMLLIILPKLTINTLGSGWMGWCLDVERSSSTMKKAIRRKDKSTKVNS